MSDTERVNIKFKAKKRPIRKRTDSSDDESEEKSEENVSGKVEEMKLLQKLRQRPKGVNIVGLALGIKTDSYEEENVKDPFKVTTGGMVNMKALKSGEISQVDDAYDTGIGTQFSAETNKRDEDEEMMKYIEEELSKKKGGLKTEDEEGAVETYQSPEEAALRAVPNHLRASSTQRSEEMLSNQMLSGIPEVDLGIEAKIKNIEATEEAKHRLIWEKRNKKDGPSQFVPTNITVNFAQQNKTGAAPDGDMLKKHSSASEIKQKQVVVEPTETKAPQKRKDGEKATDDYYYEKFKKQFRRY